MSPRAELDRRVALAGLGLLTLGACTGGHGSAAAPSPSPSPSPSGSPSPSPHKGPTGDLSAVTLAASLEAVTVMAYQQVTTATGQGELGAVAPVVTTMFATVLGHHQQHAAAWAGFLNQNHLPGGPDPLTTPALTAAMHRLSTARDIATALGALLTIERTAAATYAAMTADLDAQAGLQTALSIAPVEAAHASVLAMLVGKEPAPHALLDLSSRVDLSALSG